MSYVDKEFAIRALSFQPKYRQVHGSDFKLNCRCKVCGDSQKDMHKARFWAYPVPSGEIRVHCFNCQYSKYLGVYLKEYEPDLYREYLLERRKESTFSTKEKKADIPEAIKAKMPIIEKLAYCDRLDKLPSGHPILKYVAKRCIPETAYKRLWFTTQWPALVNSVKPGTYPHETNEPRLVIPIFNEKKEIESFQGRALTKDAGSFKYITIKAHELATKVYGLDTVDERQAVWVMEGPLDSLFIPNAIAITGGQMALDIVPFKETRIWVMDNEPRHPDTISRMKKLIDAGERIVFWDKAPWPSKDINDMIKDDGATPEAILAYMKANNEQGLMAKMRMTKYAKI